MELMLIRPCGCKAGVKIHDHFTLVWVIQRVSPASVIARSIVREANRKPHPVQPLVDLKGEQRAVR
jgi:hypothetical protein